MGSRMLSDLTPSCEAKARLFLTKCQEKGLPVHVTCTGRSEAEQQALYSQGREVLEIVNAKRKACGLWALREEENKRPVTWTLESLHIIHFDPATGNALNKARAFDVAIVKDKQFVWDLKVDANDNDIPDWDEIGKIGEECGLVWGGIFRKPDRPHFQDGN